MQPTEPLSPSNASATQASDDALKIAYLSTLNEAVYFTAVSVVAIVALFWANASKQGLLIWATAVIAASLLPHALHYLEQPLASWKNLSAIAELVSATTWVSLCLLAMPDQPDWQAFQAMLLVVILMSTLANSSSGWLMHVGSVIPHAIIPPLAFFLQASGPARSIWLVEAVAVPFVLITAAKQRAAFVSRVVVDELETKNSELLQRSERDDLTQLLNRSAFHSRLEDNVADRIAKAHTPDSKAMGGLTVCYLDLDRFKQVNDKFGHSCGDQLLVSVARRLEATLVEGEILARLGGDEMAVLSEQLDATRTNDVGERLLAAFDEPFTVEERSLYLAASAGVARFDTGLNATQLLRYADVALSEAKAQGGRRVEIFNAELHDELVQRRAHEREVVEAFESGEIQPYLQPVVDVSTGQIIGAEALIRWEHPSGLRDAGSFVGVLEDVGLIGRLNQAVATTARELDEVFTSQLDRTVPIALNVSPDSLEQMLEILSVTGKVPSAVIEITEQHAFSDQQRALVLLEQARSAGFGVLLDDFGTGYSTLSAATTFPIDGIKIDRSFISEINHSKSALAVVQAIVHVATQMGLSVIAEGVETADQLAVVKGLGVRLVQGYYFSKAVPAQTFRDWVLESRTFAEDGMLTAASVACRP